MEDFANRGMDVKELGFGENGPGHDPTSSLLPFGRGNTEQLRAALGNDIVFASERHAAVFPTLGLSVATAGYSVLTHDPQGADGESLTRIPG